MTPSRLIVLAFAFVTTFVSSDIAQENVTGAKTCSGSGFCVQKAQQLPAPIQPGTITATPAQSSLTANQTTQVGNAPKLSLHDAEQLAIKNHPRITMAELNALASKQIAR